MASNTSNIAIAELSIYPFILFVSFWLIIKYNFIKAISWFCIFFLSILHIIGSSYQISTPINIDDAINIFDTLNLAFILLAFLGIIQRL